MEELLKQLLEAELAKVQKAAETPAETPAAPTAPAFDVAALAEALKPLIETVVEERVAKAMPVRQEGVGPKGEPTQPAINPAAELVKKAREGNLTPAQKSAVWQLTYNYLKQGLKTDPSEK